MNIRGLFLLSFLMGCVLAASAQLYPYNWRIGVSAGYTTYFGDLSPFQVNGLGEADKLFRLYDLNPNYIPQPSFQLSIEAKLSPTVGVALKGGRYSFAMADRFVNRKGELRTDTPNFIRSLNFKTDVTDIGFSFVFSADNGKILNKKAFLAPYFGIGAGILWYDVYADLYDSDGMPYEYNNLEINYNGDYETELRPLRTEGVSYARHAYYAELSLGLRFRLAHRWELFLQSDFRYTTTDYLDDVSGHYRASYATPEQQYAANPIGMPEAGGDNFRGSNNGLNDFYFYHGIGIKFSFAHRSESFRAPVITGQHWDTASQTEPRKGLPRTEAVRAPVDKEKKVASLVTRNDELDDVIEPSLRFLENELDLLEARESDRRLSAREDSLMQLTRALDSMQRALALHLDTLPNDTLVQQELAQKQAENEILRHRLDSLYHARVDLLESPERRDTLMLSEREQVVRRDSITEKAIPTTRTDTLRIGEVEALERKMERMQRQQSARDSVIIMRLADLLGERQQPAIATERSVVEKYYTDTAGVSQRTTTASPRSQPTGDSELESLRREVRALRESIEPQAPTYTPSPDRGRDVTVVPGAPVIIREGSRDTLRASEYEAMQRERERLKFENEALRRELKQKEFELNLFLDPPKVADQIDPLDTLATDTITEPAAPDTTANETELMERLRKTAEREEKAREKERAKQAAEEVVEDVAVEPNEEPEKPAPKASPELDAMQVNVFFALNSTTVKESERAKLKQAADQWKKNKAQLITLTSYADNTGNPEYNKKLCARRNEAVKKVLVDELGVEAEKIKGEIGGKVLRNGKAWNPDDRRVEVVVIPAK